MTARTFTDLKVQEANDSGCIFYDDPATLRDEQIDPLLRPAVRRINRSGWVWTAESCQGHPDAESAWVGNTRPMLRLVCHARNRPRMMDALCQASAEANDDQIGGRVMGLEVWAYKRRNGWFEALVYVPAKTVGDRNAGIRVYERFAELVAA